MVVTEQMKKELAELAREYNIALLVLFGSQATGHTHKKSDVDIGFLSRTDIDYRKCYELSVSLARIFKNRDVELVNLGAVSPELKKQVADQGLLLHEEHPSAFDLFKIHANRIYMETKPLRRYRDEYLNYFLKKHA